MQSQSIFFEGVARAMTGALGVAQGLSDEARAFMRSQADRVAAEFDLVTRDEFETVRQMAAEARAEVEALRARVEALEAALGARG